jgi:hypothetical protein
MTTSLFGSDVLTINAMQKNGFLTAVAGYDTYNVIMNFAKNGRYYAVIYAEKDIIVREIGIADIYSYEVLHFTEMVRTGVSPLTVKQLTAPVFIMNAIERSLDSGKTEKVEQL